MGDPDNQRENERETDLQARTFISAGPRDREAVTSLPCPSTFHLSVPGRAGVAGGGERSCTGLQRAPLPNPWAQVQFWEGSRCSFPSGMHWDQGQATRCLSLAENRALTCKCADRGQEGSRSGSGLDMGSVFQHELGGRAMGKGSALEQAALGLQRTERRTSAPVKPCALGRESSLSRGGPCDGSPYTGWLGFAL